MHKVSVFIWLLLAHTVQIHTVQITVSLDLTKFNNIERQTLEESVSGIVVWKGKCLRYISGAELEPGNMIISKASIDHFYELEEDLKTDMKDFLEYVSQSHPIKMKEPQVKIIAPRVDCHRSYYKVKWIVTGSYEFEDKALDETVHTHELEYSIHVTKDVYRQLQGIN